MDNCFRILSIVLTLATWVWDAYAQAKGIPYKIDDVWKGLILSPIAKWGMDKAVSKGKELLKKPDPKP